MLLKTISDLQMYSFSDSEANEKKFKLKKNSEKTRYILYFTKQNEIL